jgi:uridine kinase
MALLMYIFKRVLLLLSQTAAGFLLQSGKSVDVPVYDFSTHARSAETRRVSVAQTCRAA